MMTRDEWARMIDEQHEIRAARFQTGPHTGGTMVYTVRDCLHLNNYLADQGL